MIPDTHRSREKGQRLKSLSGSIKELPLCELRRERRRFIPVIE
jgi:hypothetical protein